MALKMRFSEQVAFAQPVESRDRFRSLDGYRLGSRTWFEMVWTCLSKKVTTSRSLCGLCQKFFHDAGWIDTGQAKIKTFEFELKAMMVDP